MATEVKVSQLPGCDICKYVGPPPGKPAQEAAYDGKTKEGPWANMCEYHFTQYGVGLGTGKGQRLILET
jgi:hypothetical protein